MQKKLNFINITEENKYEIDLLIVVGGDGFMLRTMHHYVMLFSACCEAASIVSGATNDETERLKNFGFNFGMAFRIVDDMLDYNC